MKTRNLTFSLLLIIIIALSSCVMHKASYAPAYSSSDTRGGTLYANDESFGGMYETKNERKVMFNAYLTLTVKCPDTANVYIEQIAKKYNGYVNQIGTYSSTIRVESDKLNDALKEIEALGRVDRKSISGQDVTDEYLDYEIRLENAQKARERYLELLEKAENVEAALKVEKELERLNETIDLLTGKMNRIDHLVQYSTITISLNEKKKPGVLGYVGMGLYYSVKWLFVRN